MRKVRSSVTFIADTTIYYIADNNAAQVKDAIHIGITIYYVDIDGGPFIDSHCIILGNWSIIDRCYLDRYKCCVRCGSAIIIYCIGKTCSICFRAVMIKINSAVTIIDYCAIC